VKTQRSTLGLLSEVRKTGQFTSISVGRRTSWTSHRTIATATL